jgi:phage replication-related protein YjqB (UPF0714/DUF867 family)
MNPSVTSDRYNNFAALRAAEPADAFSIAVCDRASQVVVAAPHGGGIEPGTSEVAVSIAGADLSYYLFEGHKRQGNAALHITSSNFDEPQGLALLRRAACVLTVHGEARQAETLYVGGLNTSLKNALRVALERHGYVVGENDNLQGRDERNVCNIGSMRAGVQLELSAGLRRSFFESLSRAGRAKPGARLAEFSAVVRKAVQNTAHASISSRPE